MGKLSLTVLTGRCWSDFS